MCQSELPIRNFAITNWQACGGQRSVLFCAPKSNEQVGEEAAMPGQPVALARVFWNVPQRFTLENHQTAAGSAAIIRQAQETSRFAEPTFRHFLLPRNTKNFRPCAEAVDVETSLWKTEEN